ncbi:MAG: PLP-dependent transferase [Planctomycetota bacterium]
MNPETRLLHRKVPVAGAHPNVTPLFQCSSFFSDSEWFYSRKSNPNVDELEAAVRDIEGCAHAVAVATGMAALTMALRLLKPGDRLAANALIYGCSYRLFADFCAHYGIGFDVLDFTDPAAVSAGIRPGTRMVIFETPTNPLLRTVPIEAVAREVRAAAPGALVVVDNTWATPLFQKPLALGADLCVVSATKFFSGHSDVMGGLVTTDRADLAEEIRKIRFYSGSNLDPHSAWLLRRSLQTFPIRMRAHAATFGEMAAHLRSHPRVRRVYVPEVDGRQLASYGGILFIELDPALEPAVEAFMDSLKLFERGTSMASVVSAVAQPWSGSHLSMTAEEKLGAGIGKTLVRLCFGLEDPADLKADLTQALDKAGVTPPAAAGVKA